MAINLRHDGVDMTRAPWQPMRLQFVGKIGDITLAKSGPSEDNSPNFPTKQ